MALFRIFLLFFCVIFGSVLADNDLDGQPKIYVVDGHLNFEVSENKHIKLTASNLRINNIDVLPAITGAQNATLLLKTYELFIAQHQSQLDNLSNKLDLLTGNTRVISSNSTTNLTYFDIKFTRLSRSLTGLRRIVTNLQVRLNKNECNSSPCKNGGTCLDMYRQFFCLCPNGWEGPTCEQDINECARFVGTDLGCQNGGTCYNLHGTYQCICPDSWIGVHCNRKPKDCGSGGAEICGHGSCIPQNNNVGYMCLCDAGWTTDGVHMACTVDVDECKNNHPPCSTNPLVMCINVPGSFMCQHCPPGYTGNGYYCADINECEILNGGCSVSPQVECINSPGSSKCSNCPPGYEGDGKTCSYKGVCNINNGGCSLLARCVDYTGTMSIPVQCICPQNYMGSGLGPNGCRRIENISPCYPNPCINGRCVTNNSTEGFQCICQNKYFGIYCDQFQDPCSANPCYNGGTCLNQGTSFRCKCTNGYTGRLCRTELEVCGGQLTSRNGTIIFPVTNSTFISSRSINCLWKIKTEESKVLQININKFNLLDEPCSTEWLQIYEESISAPSRRFCGKTIPLNGSFTTPHNEVTLWLKSRGQAGQKAEIEITWHTIEPVCGGKITGDAGIISSPGWPSAYPKNRNCTWHFSVHPDKRLLFHVYSLDIGIHNDCSGDSIMFLTKMYSLSFDEAQHYAFHKLCNSTIPQPFYSPSPEGQISFKSGQNSPHAGFQIGYSTVDGIPECGGTYTSRDGYIQSVQFSESMDSQLNCLYQIKIPTNETIIIDILELNLPKPCTQQGIAFYQGTTTDAPFLGRYCGTTLPGPIIAVGDSLLIESRTTQRGPNRWKLKYSIVCSRVLKEAKNSIEFSGSSLSPIWFPICTYLIEQPESTIILLSLNIRTVTSSPRLNCLFSSVEVRDGDNKNSTLLGTYCSGKAKLQSSTNYLWIKITPGPNRFYANYTTINTGCGGLLKTDRRSISYPPQDTEKYLSNSKCRWVIVAPPTKIIQLTWITFNIEQSHDCTYDNLKVFDNITDFGQGDLIGKYCGNKPPPTLLSQSNIMTIDFKSDASINEDGFLVSYAFLKQENICGGNYYTSTGVIRSPGYPKGYPSNRECIWTITVPPGSQIMLNVTHFNIEKFLICRYDYLEIRNGGTSASPIIGTYCGENIPKYIYSHTNKLFLKFRSDMSKSAPGFKIRWSSAATGCGGALMGPTGSIMSPHYPEPYAKSTECLWKILVSAGSKIQVIFADLNLEEHSKCNLDYVELIDGYTLNSKSIGKFCKPQLDPIQSTMNKMLVKFRSDISYEGRGFHLQFATICKNTLKGFSGIIESPNFPNQYPVNQNCEWDIIVPSKNKINITFSHFSLEGRTNSCLYDYVEILYESQVIDSDERNFLQYGKYCTETNPGLITLNADHAKIRFVSDDLLLGNGFRLEWQLFGCGGELSDTFGTLQTPNYPKPYPPSIQCNWVITAPVGQAISLTILNLDVERDTTCNFDYVEVYDGSDENSNLLAKSCHIEHPVSITSSSHQMFISFKADFSYQGKGFAAYYATEKAKCGGTLYLPSGYIYSPNYPKNYNSNQTCEWLIITDINHRVQIKFEEIDLVGRNCNKTSIEIYDGSDEASPLLQTICGSGVNQSQIYTSTYYSLYIKFISYDVLTSKGFKAKFSKTCGAVIKTSSSGIIQLSKEYAFRNLENDEFTNCSFTIQSEDPTKHIFLTITRMSDNNFWCEQEIGVIVIYNGLSSDAPLQGSYCSDKIPPTIISEGSALHLVIKEYITLYASYSVFDNECGGDIIGLMGNIASPGWPTSYPNNISCVWTISHGPGNTISLSFSSFDIPESQYCNSDYVEIRESNETGKLLGVYCGNKLPLHVNNTYGKIVIIFKSSSLGDGVPSTKKGFYLEFGYNSNNKLTGSSGEIGNPLYPLSFATYEPFSWLITTKPKTRIELTFQEFFTDSDQDNCINSGFKIYDGMNEDAILLKTVCGHELPSSIISTSNMLLIASDYFSNRLPTKFLLSWKELSTSVKAKVTNTTDCRYIYQVNFQDNITISSPGYPTNIQTTKNCEWIFETNQISHLKIVILDLDFSLWPRQTCAYSTSLKLLQKSYESGDFELLKEICTNSVNTLIFYGTHMVKILFKPFTFLARRGFQAVVSTVCGGYLTESSGYIVFDKDHDRGTECQWNITVGSGRTINLKFLSFDLGGTNISCKNTLTIRNGKFPDSPLLGQGKYCGSNIPPMLSSSSNHLYLKYTGIADIKGFKLKYEQVSVECGGRITLSSMDTFTEISSPKYPNIPDPHTECIWVVTGIPGERLRVDFEERFDFTHSIGCDVEYLELRNGGTEWSPLISRYCNEMPQTKFTTDNVLWIKYFTDTDDPKNGFKLKVSLGICGGTFHGSKDFSTRNILGKIELNKNCTWHLITVEGYYLEIKFKEMQLKGSVHLYENINGNVTDLGTYTGNKIPNKTIKSIGHDVIMDYMPTDNNDEYTLEFNTKTDSCSKTYTQESGIITSPGYPLSKPSKWVCLWEFKVPNGRRITFFAEDVDTDNAIFVLSNGLGGGIKITDTIEAQQTYETSDNTATIIYGQINPTNHRGIKLIYTSNKPSACQGSFNNTDGIIETPNVTAYMCKWSRQIPESNSTLLLAINLKTNETAGTCYLYSSGITLQIRSHVTHLCHDTKNRPYILRIPSTTAKLSARKNRFTVSNFTISYKTYPCGGFINSMQGTISSPNYPNPPKTSMECAWAISTDPSYRIKINVTSLELGDDCDKSYLNIYNGFWSDMPRIGKYCRNNKPATIITEAYEAYIEYRYVEGGDRNSKGFSLDFEPHITSCGGIFQHSYSIIMTPNYKENYPNNAECLWEIEALSGRIIELTFTDRFHIEQSTGCVKDFVEIFDWTNIEWVSKGKFCGREAPKIIKSSANRMRILFRSDGNITATGFEAMTTWECGGHLIATKTVNYLMSPNYPNFYTAKLNCTYTITPSTKNGVFVIRYLDFDLREGTPTCIYDNFTIQTSNRPNYNQLHCGKKLPPDERFDRAIKIIFNTDQYFRLYRGFKLSYSMDDCGGNVTEPTAINLQDMAKANYYLSYNPSLKCFWNITAPPKQIPVLNIHKLTLMDSYCYKYHLKVYDGVKILFSKLLSQLCKTVEDYVISATSNSMLIYLDISLQAFTIMQGEIYFTYGPEAGCGGVIYLNETEKTVPIEGPENLPDMDCHWKISAPRDYKIKIEFLEININPNCNSTRKQYTTFCTCAFIEVKDGGGPQADLMSKLCTSDNRSPRTFRTSWNTAYIRLFSAGHQNRPFSLRVSVFMTPCGRSQLVSKNSPQTLTSPGYPQSYLKDISCTWTITDDSDRKTIQIHFNDFDLQDENSEVQQQLNTCGGDHLEISNDPSKLVIMEGYGLNSQHLSALDFYRQSYNTHLFCGKNEKPFDYYSVGKTLVIKFTSNEFGQKGRGFNLTYGNIGCDRNIYANEGRIKNQKVVDNCYISITSDVNTTLSLYFLSLNVYPNYNCTRGGLEVRENNATGPVLLKFCGYGVPNPVFSNQNKLYILYKALPSLNPFSYRLGRNVNYDFLYVASKDGVGCGGKIYNYMGKFSSPMYPNIYREEKICSWNVKVPIGYKIALKFPVFEITGACLKNKLVVTTYKSGIETEHVFCQNENPAVLFSDLTVNVIYYSSVNNGGVGWVANFQAVKKESSSLSWF